MSRDAFVEAYRAGTSPFGLGLRLWKNAVWFSIQPSLNSGSVVNLNRISAVRLGCGHGSLALDWLVALAREHSVTIEGHADVNIGSPGGLTEKELGRWYKRHGFHVSRDGKITLPTAAAG